MRVPALYDAVIADVSVSKEVVLKCGRHSKTPTSDLFTYRNQDLFALLALKLNRVIFPHVLSILPLSLSARRSSRFDARERRPASATGHRSLSKLPILHYSISMMWRKRVENSSTPLSVILTPISQRSPYSGR